MQTPQYPAKESEPEVRHYLVRLLGTGASAPTKQLGDGITVTRTSEGLYKLTWAASPGAWGGLTYGLQAATPADMAGHTLVADTFDTSAFSLEVLLSDSAFAADDLDADEYIHLDIWFKQTSV